MARQNPVPEIDQQIGKRLRKFRIEIQGLSAVEFARRIDIDSNRLATYEHGRAPIRYDIADHAANVFNISQRWLVEGLEPVNYYVAIDRELREKIPERAIFSSVYNDFLKPHIEEHFASLVHLWDGKFDQEGLDVMQEMGQNHVGGVSALFALNFLYRNLVHVVRDIPPDLFQQFYNDISRAGKEFRQQNSKRIEEWQKTPKVDSAPAWTLKNSTDGEKDLTDTSEVRKVSDVKSEIQQLLERVRALVSAKGMKAKLATSLNVPQSRLSEWLGGKCNPSGETTLRLLHWVEQQERQK